MICKERMIQAGAMDKYTAADDFIDEDTIEAALAENRNPRVLRIRDILQKSLAVETLDLNETAALLNVQSDDVWEEMFSAAASVKKKVYDNRIVTFAPLYCSNYCVNDCAYCGFKSSNVIERNKLSDNEIRQEVGVLAGEIGHKRLIAVYGEHPCSGVDYIANSLEAIYSVRVKTKKGLGQIRRVNVNCAPLLKEELKALKKAGIGTYQVFQETYHRKTYENVHPVGTIKGDYYWRLYCMHRALEAGIDDVGIGVLFGLYDWKFEVMGLVSHARDLEKRFGGIGPHTVSIPRLEPALNAACVDDTAYKVSDRDFKRLAAVIRLAIPYAGMIITARESQQVRMDVIPVGCTQTDASTRIGIGVYNKRYLNQEENRQQFLLRDTRSLDELVAQLAEMGYITSFCTAGYRCGRTGGRIMELLRSGREGQFCKLNAILTFREWLDDFASVRTKSLGEALIVREMEEVRHRLPSFYPKLTECYENIMNGQRDIYF
ncbi:MAG: [FeFe] hydrogenase H-cluster radical SAM maturase HydG [Candidatus Omnitrophica bacterium]|nr:[FeFe] hydrogenase H-cluster radical SAM maturase HydG [Candidatus Omnitrophota bacterium]